jgi:protein-S-isoprenylcysteine O-methyltransferase Ste14
MTLILNSILWVVFFISHSYLAAIPVKESLISKLKWSEQRYRFAYSFLSFLLVAAIYLIQFLFPKPLFLKLENWVFYFGVFLLLIGIIFNLLAFKNISAREFIGLQARKTKADKLIQKGIYTLVRHPIYTGLISLMMGFAFLQPTSYNALNFLLILIYLPIGIYFEEQKLIQLYDQDYLVYKKKVKAIIPFLI